MNYYNRFKRLKIDHGCLGFQLLKHYGNCYCTPKDAVILGSAGVDGIHYCTIPKFGEMVFAVSPMNFGDCVHPIARDFKDLLRLLLSCVDMAALEQCYAWDEEQYKAFLIDCPATVDQQEALNVIRNELDLESIEDVFAYVKNLQAEFDLSQIPYTRDYYDIDMNPAAPESAPEWKITFRGNFDSVDHQGTPGVPVDVHKEFHWAGIDWVIPEVYACEEGLVVLTFGKVAPAEVRKYMTGEPATQEDIEWMDAKCPLNIHLRCRAKINGSEGIYCGGNGMAWMPPQPGEGRGHLEAKWVLEHYGFDTNYAWIINRDNYRWRNGEKRKINSLVMTVTQRPVSLSGTHFKTPADSKVVELKHPRNNEIFTLTIENVTQEKADMCTMASMGMEFPTCYTQLEYRIQPEFPPNQFRIVDCAHGDNARPAKIAKSDDVQLNGGAATIGIIGGADGPTAIFVSHPTEKTPELHMASSAMRFEHADEIVWRAVFMEKLHPDIEVVLL